MQKKKRKIQFEEAEINYSSESASHLKMKVHTMPANGRNSRKLIEAKKVGDENRVRMNQTEVIKYKEGEHNSTIDELTQTNSNQSSQEVSNEYTSKIRKGVIRKNCVKKMAKNNYKINSS